MRTNHHPIQGYHSSLTAGTSQKLETGQAIVQRNKACVLRDARATGGALLTATPHTVGVFLEAPVHLGNVREIARVSREFVLQTVKVMANVSQIAIRFTVDASRDVADNDVT